MSTLLPENFETVSPTDSDARLALESSRILASRKLGKKTSVRIRLGDVDHFAWDKLVDLDGASLRSNLRKRVLIDDLPIDRVVHELPRELDPLVDRRRSHSLGFELLVRPFRVASSNLVGRPNSQGEIVTAIYVFSDA
jgi:hypothetical protein